ncbi:hypothetical protein A5N81_27055 [Pseudomonas aeruginosa]|nr:hypothetical protein A5N81_27055 [Pseudomonas aeruginosa]
MGAEVVVDDQDVAIGSPAVRLGFRLDRAAPAFEQRRGGAQDVAIIFHQAHPQTGEQAGLLTGLRVCLVEDDRNVLRATSALLERWGCTVQAETEADGWRTDCDILVVDYDLGPHASGVECIERVRRQRGEAIPALVISGHDIERIQDSVEDTDIALLSKPVRPTELRATLRALRERPEAASHAS